MIDDYDVEKKKLISDFNEAKFQIFRLHDIWDQCNVLSCSGKLMEWKWKLDAAWRELRKDAKDYDEGKEDDEDSFKKKIERANALIKLCKSNDSLYSALSDKEMILRELQDASGKGSKKRREDEDLMD